MDGKVCYSCGELKPRGEFYPNKGRKDGLQTKCKSCNKKRYESNKPYFREINKGNRRRLKQAIDDIKAKAQCADCGSSYEPHCMDFDHIGVKRQAVAKMAHDTWSLGQILEEIKSTELVCVLCHKTRTYSKFWNRPLKNKRQIENRELIRAAKNTPCAECGGRYDHWQMEFDHIDPTTKSCAVSLMALTAYSRVRLEEEIRKCEVLCALCHRRKSVASMRKEM